MFKSIMCFSCVLVALQRPAVIALSGAFIWFRVLFLFSLFLFPILFYFLRAFSFDLSYSLRAIFWSGKNEKKSALTNRARTPVKLCWVAGWLVGWLASYVWPAMMDLFMFIFDLEMIWNVTSIEWSVFLSLIAASICVVHHFIERLKSIFFWAIDCSDIVRSIYHEIDITSVRSINFTIIVHVMNVHSPNMKRTFVCFTSCSLICDVIRIKPYKRFVEQWTHTESNE